MGDLAIRAEHDGGGSTPDAEPANEIKPRLGIDLDVRDAVVASEPRALDCQLPSGLGTGCTLATPNVSARLTA